MKRYTRDELYEFVWRADTPKKIAVAAEWLSSHVADLDLWDDLMRTLALQYRNYSRAESGRPLI